MSSVKDLSPIEMVTKTDGNNSEARGRGFVRRKKREEKWRREKKKTRKRKKMANGLLGLSIPILHTFEFFF